MKAHLRKLLTVTGNTFWLLPVVFVVMGIVAGVGLVAVDRNGIVPHWLIASPWLYNGGATGARTLLGAVASSTIGVAGTVFSITIAALSLAAGQMGPRLLRNFTRDRGNQVTLGTFLDTFSYALMFLRSVRTQSEGLFVPNLALSIAILLALSASLRWCSSLDIWPSVSTWTQSSSSLVARYGPQPSPHFGLANPAVNTPAPDTASANCSMSGASLCSGMLGMSS